MAVTGQTTRSCWNWNVTQSHSLGTWRHHRVLVCSTFQTICLHLKCKCLSFLGVSAIRGCEYGENFSDVIHGNFVVKLNALGRCGLQGKACLWNCKSPFSSYVSPRRGSLSWCDAYATSVSLQVSFFLVFTFQAGILICEMGRHTTATAEGPKFEVHSVTVYRQSKQKVTLTYAILLCHFMAVLCFPPSYLLLLITYFFLPSVVNKVQSNLLSKCGFLSPLVSRDCWQLGVCGLMGKNWSRKKEQVNGLYLDPGLGICVQRSLIC